MGWLSELLGGRPRVQPVSVTDDNFADEVLRSRLPVLLDVWSPTCGPCQKLAPIVVDLASAYDGRVKVCELNVANGPGAASRLGVRSVPVVVYFDRGKERDRVVGFRSSLYHEQAIEELFGIPKKPPRPS